MMAKKKAFEGTVDDMVENGDSYPPSAFYLIAYLSKVWPISREDADALNESLRANNGETIAFNVR